MTISNLPKNLAEINYDCIIGETELALQFDFGDTVAWIPKSQIDELFDDVVIIPKWLAQGKELI